MKRMKIKKHEVNNNTIQFRKKLISNDHTCKCIKTKNNNKSVSAQSDTFLHLTELISKTKKRKNKLKTHKKKILIN